MEKHHEELSQEIKNDMMNITKPLNKNTFLLKNDIIFNFINNSLPKEKFILVRRVNKMLFTLEGLTQVTLTFETVDLTNETKKFYKERLLSIKEIFTQLKDDKLEFRKNYKV